MGSFYHILLFFQEKLDIRIFMDPIQFLNIDSYVSLSHWSQLFILPENRITHPQLLPCNSSGVPNRTDRIDIAYHTGLGFGHVIWITQWNLGKKWAVAGFMKHLLFPTHVHSCIYLEKGSFLSPRLRRHREQPGTLPIDCNQAQSIPEDTCGFLLSAAEPQPAGKPMSEK